MTIGIHNNSTKDFWFNQKILLSEWLKYQSFSVYGGPSQITCAFHTGKDNLTYNYNLIISGETIWGPEILLSNVCSFEDVRPGQYTFYMVSSSRLYTDEQYELDKNNCTPMGTIEYFQDIHEIKIILGETDEKEQEH